MTETELIIALQDAYKEMRAGDETQIEIRLRYAALLLDARRRHPSNQAFAVWLATHGVDQLSADDRAAFLNIAEYPDLYRKCAAESGRYSVQLIWREEMQPRLRSATKTEVVSSSGPVEPSNDTGQVSDHANSPRSKTSPRDQTSRSPLKDFPKSALVLGHISSGDTRSLLGGLMRKKTGRPIWTLLVEMIEAGAFGPPTNTATTTPNLRLIFPWAPTHYARQWDLTNRDQIKRVRELVLPVVLEHRDRLLREPDALVPLLGEAAEAKRRAFLESKQLDPASKHRAAVATLPVTEQEIVMYGQALWPATFTPAWTYQELLEACWFYRTVAPMLLSINSQRKLTHCAQDVRQSINVMMKWLPLRATPFAAAVRQIGLAYEANAEGECRVPPPPPNFGIG